MINSTEAPVLLVTQVFPPVVGGSGVLLENVYRRLPRLDVKVLTDGETSGGTDTQRGSLHIERTVINGQHWGLGSPAAIRQHVRLARKIADHVRTTGAIVHCGRALPEAMPALMARAFTRRLRYLFWAYGEDVTTAWTSRDFTFAMRLTHAGAAAAVAISRNGARVLESAGMAPDRIHVVYPGVDTDRFSPSVNGGAIRNRYAGLGDVLLLSVGRLVPRKGHDVVLAALHRLRDSSIRYVIVGDGPERVNLEMLTAQYGLQQSVFFAGEVDTVDLAAYFSASDIFVLANRPEGSAGHDFEGFGLVFLEAAASGKPTIGGRNGGVPEAVEDGVTGLLAEGRDVEEFASRIATLTSSETLRRRMGAAGRDRAVRQFSWQRAADAVAAIHESLATAGHARPSQTYVSAELPERTR